MAITVTAVNAKTATATSIDTNESNCKSKFATLNTNATSINSNFTAINAERIVYQTSNITGNDSAANALPAGYVVREVIFKTIVEASNNVTVDIGTSSGGKQIVEGGTITKTLNAVSRMSVKSHAVPTSATTLYFSSSNWESGTFVAYIVLEKVVF